ncbi:MAG: hypothetical protein COV29_03115 [Candidatus Yanofskybacteria bacterium CG10_big_fil_rev_8_21_14_0_10_36_16]|uniref:Uncharacterized protein n=1 Tax=Candidatus Yanofskybacteria bacterium CG10_big_fil_rev_8_21_14_0_10_36_16 TaxID=1975096 RepID=A0A2J0Q6X2_9BACT|nr:MAG: hypothetical protein COV29_03115 [Candidatus Yanofskybacteria bacterium CG10_big_fil_rev_8_21_14_0_10_36_16]
MTHWSETKKGRLLGMTAFAIVDLPEVKEENLEKGTYTNKQIARMCETPQKLMTLLKGLPTTATHKKLRIIISSRIKEMQEQY